MSRPGATSSLSRFRHRRLYRCCGKWRPASGRIRRKSSESCFGVFGMAVEMAEERMAIATALMISTRTLDEAAARKLFTQAVEDAHGKILAAEAKIKAAR